MPISFRGLGCGFFVTNLHKWFGVPFRNGMPAVSRQPLGERAIYRVTRRLSSKWVAACADNVEGDCELHTWQ
jgi:selenocysteine lyase/cysteine desulfurase